MLKGHGILEPSEKSLRFHRGNNQIIQLKLDYFLTGSTTIFNSPPTASNFQNKESPTDNPNCWHNHFGTVVRILTESDVAFDMMVFVPSGNRSPNRDIEAMVYNLTYPLTIKLIYLPTYIGNENTKKIGKMVRKMTLQNPRQLRGLAILSGGLEAIKRVSDYEYKVKSQHGKHYYTVKNGETGVSCTCPNWQEYKSDCKHVYAVEFSMQLRLEVEKDIANDNIVVSPNQMECPDCGSVEVIKYGKKKCKKGIQQNYQCKSCKRQFVGDQAFSRYKATSEAIVVSQDLYFKGVSLAKIQHHLKMFYNTNVNRSTIMRWIHKFSKILSEYSEKHKPQVGDLWHSDEMTATNRANGKGIKNHDWIWNLMDSDTRYLLASKITKTRYARDAQKPLKEGKIRAGKKPKALITDGLQGYQEAVRKEFGSRSGQTIHFRTPSKRKYFLNQNLERLNGTVRERLKVMRGYDHEETGQIILDGERFYYNNIRPHTSLDGMTPGQIAGMPHVPVNDNPWLTFIRLADKERRKTIRDATAKIN